VTIVTTRKKCEKSKNKTKNMHGGGIIEGKKIDSGPIMIEKIFKKRVRR